MCWYSSKYHIFSFAPYQNFGYVTTIAHNAFENLNRSHLACTYLPYIWISLTLRKTIKLDFLGDFLWYPSLQLNSIYQLGTEWVFILVHSNLRKDHSNATGANEFLIFEILGHPFDWCDIPCQHLVWFVWFIYVPTCKNDFLEGDFHVYFQLYYSIL